MGANMQNLTVTYRFQLGGEGKTEEVPCDAGPIDRALCRPGSGGWSWQLDPITSEQAKALGVYETEGGDHVLSLPQTGYVLVTIDG